MIARAFANPEWLSVAAWSLALLAGALALGAWRARRRTRRLLGPGATGRPADLAGDLALWTALLAIAVALLGPRIGERTVRVPQSGVDLVVLVDISLSMDAQDVPPSRLDRARRAGEAILRGLRAGDRAALAVFAGIGVLLTPLSADTQALVEMLPALDSGLMRPRGSRLDAGVRAALEAFEPTSDRPRVVMLLSDGEDADHREALGTDAALRAHTRVVAAAFGSDRGTTVPDHGVPHRDPAGRVVTSRRDASRLALLTRATDGALLRADQWGAIDVANAVAEIRRDAGGNAGEPTERRVPARRVAPFAALAFALLVGELAPLSGLRRLAGAARRRRRALALAALFLGLVGAADVEPSIEVRRLEDAARAAPRDARLLLRLGHARAVDGALDEAARAFHAAALYASEPRRAALAYYDLGVIELARSEHAAARDAFFDALALAPDDVEARYNLEWALRELAKVPPPAASTSKPRPRPPDADAQSGRGAAPAEERARVEAAGTASPAQWREIALGEDEAERWLRSLEDDAARALRATVRAAGARTPARSPRAATW